MKLQGHKTTRTGDHVVVNARWTDQMRRMCGVTVHLDKNITDVDAQEFITGDAKEVSGVLFGAADIAWEMGWRPRGLIGRIAAMIEGYKLPPVV